MTLLTGLFFFSLALLALATYLVLEYLQQAELSAYRQLARVQQEAHLEQYSAGFPLQSREPSGFFLVGSGEPVEKVATDEVTWSQDPAAGSHRHCA